MDLKELISIERKIVIGMIVNTDFLKYTHLVLNIEWVQSTEARLIMRWVYEYFHKYGVAPNRNIQDIYMEKLRLKKVNKEQGEIIENILESLSFQSQDEESNNTEYLKDQTETYAKACKLNLYTEEVTDHLEAGRVLEAENLLVNYEPVEAIKSQAVIPLGTTEQIKNAFKSFSDTLIQYQGDLGRMINSYMVREGFVVLLGQNKGGKSNILADAAIRAATQGRKVAFFQGGDMSQSQMERRLALYMSKRSDMTRYCGPLFIPVLDCIYNQNGECDRKDREGGQDRESPFENENQERIRDKTYKDLVSTYETDYDHIPCYNCLRNKKRRKYFRGTIWYKKRGPVQPLIWKDTYRQMNKKWRKVMENIRLITYPSETLNTAKFKAELDILEKSGFFSEIQIIDYLDLMGPDNDTKHLSTRDQRNKNAARLRGVSQERKSLVLSASQSDAQGFDKKFLDKKNFNEDRRLLDHVTALIGLNMSIDEKKKGIMRINDIVARDTEGTSYVHVLHRLQIGRPILHSFF